MIQYARSFRVIYLTLLTIALYFSLQSCDTKEAWDSVEKDKYESETNNDITQSDGNIENLGWAAHLSGIQCDTLYFRSLESALEVLDSNRITIYESKVVEFTTNSACGTGNGKYFLAKIHKQDFDKVKELGWGIIGPNELGMFGLDE